MKNVKLRVPEGKVREAHEFMNSLGYHYASGIGFVSYYAEFLFGNKNREMTLRCDDGEDYFLKSDAEEIFLPGHEPAPAKKKHIWDKEIRALLDGERVECSGNYGDAWFTLTLKDIGLFVEGNIFRIKPRTMTINGMEFPEPMREAPEEGTECYLVDAAFRIGADRFRWAGTTTDLNWLKRGLIQATEEGAIAQAKAMVSALGGEWE